MTITRPQINELPIVGAEADDHGNVTIALYTATGVRGVEREITPDEARELIAELTTAITTADEYRAEQTGATR